MRVTVERVEIKTLPVECKKFPRQRKARVVLDGKVLGMAYSRATYPSSVDVITVTTSHETFTIASHTLPSYVWEESYYGDQHFRRGTREFKTRVTLSCGVKMNFTIARKLKVGQPVGVLYPFHLMGGVVTDGKLNFPLHRPHGDEWQEHDTIRFANGVSQVNWTTMLRAIVGLYFDGKVNEWKVRVKDRVRSIRNSDRRIRDLEEKLKKGQCFNGDGMQKVAIGRNLLFVGRSKDGEPIYIVDAPEYGRALYIFQERQTAFDWASRKIDAKAARELATLWTPHIGEWEKRTSLAI